MIFWKIKKQEDKTFSVEVKLPPCRNHGKVGDFPQRNSLDIGFEVKKPFEHDGRYRNKRFL
jgi:hypothetical protein